jgi:hypothetical protein
MKRLQDGRSLIVSSNRQAYSPRTLIHRAMPVGLFGVVDHDVFPPPYYVGFTWILKDGTHIRYYYPPNDFNGARDTLYRINSFVQYPPPFGGFFYNLSVRSSLQFTDTW